MKQLLRQNFNEVEWGYIVSCIHDIQIINADENEYSYYLILKITINDIKLLNQFTDKVNNFYTGYWISSPLKYIRNKPIEEQEEIPELFYRAKPTTIYVKVDEYDE